MPTSRRPRTPTTFPEVLDRWPSLSLIATELGVSYFTVASWKRRNAIPQLWWTELERAARRQRLSGITYALLRKIEAERQSHRRRVPAPGDSGQTLTEPPLATVGVR